jgi:hypothetical protein
VKVEVADHRAGQLWRKEGENSNLEMDCAGEGREPGCDGCDVRFCGRRLLLDE